ncbi:hypothetical protein ACIRNU_12240 [Streptomyces rochei]|uniref:hypothetical protein n=1 Tax=Streptomyces rochei TaxID=1928 RepID=UPI00380F3553
MTIDLAAETEEERRGVVRSNAVRTQLQTAAKEAGVFALHVAPELGGHGLDTRGRAGLRGGRILAALAVGVEHRGAGRRQHPHAGNHRDLGAERALSAPVRHRRGALVLRHDRAGAQCGSRPQRAVDLAERVPGGWRIHGHKWFITGLARTRGEAGDRGGATMFLVDADNPGMKTVRHIETLDESLFRGHIELPLHDCFVPYDAVRCAVDEGFVCTRHRQRLPFGSEFETVGETPASLVAAGLCALRRKS